MKKKNITLMDRLAEKNFIDTIILGLVAILIVVTIFFNEDKTIMILISVIFLMLFFVQSQLSRNKLVKLIEEMLKSEKRISNKHLLKLLV
jgi:ABC-type multidrug transport system fused ATPase/permease subunit